MGTNYNPRTSTNGLVLCLDAANKKSYPGTGNTWYDLSGIGNNGSLINGVGYTNDNKGSFVFDGVNDYVSLGNTFRYQDNFTVEAIAKFPALPNNSAVCTARHPIIYNHDYGYNLLVNATGKVEWQIYNTVSQSKSVVSTNSIIGSSYFYAVGIKSGVTIYLYINGILHSQTNLSTNAVYYAANPFTIGGYAVCGGSRFYATGNISKVSVYNRVLTSSEISKNFNAVRGRYGT